MKAIILNQQTYKFEIKDVVVPTISETGVLIKLKVAAINHHELWSIKEKDLKSDSDIIMGSDGAGIIEAVGAKVNHIKKGDEVIINPSINWGTNSRVHGDNYEILGFPTQGTFAEYICVDHQYVHYKPEHLSFQEAAALPLSGLTAYRALFSRGEIEQYNKVLITGIGGGVALFALRFAVAAGAEVYVTSGDQNKIAKAIELGAIAGANYNDSNWSADLQSKMDGFDVIIDSAAGDGFSKLTELAKPGGRIALFGRTTGNIPNLSPKIIFWKQLSIHGTTMGSNEEFKEMIALISSQKIHPVIDATYSANDINLAFEKMDRGEQFGKIVIKMDEFI